MENHLTQQVKITEAITEAAGVAATTDINGAIIDMSGFECVTMVIVMGAIVATAVTSVKAQQDTDPAGATMADLAGSGQTIADTDDGKTYVIDIIRPRERYVRCVVDRGTANATVRAAFYIQHGAHEQPVVSQGSTIVVERHVDLIEGTA